MPGQLRTALDTTLAALDIADRDQAAAALARALADEIDDAEKAERWASTALVAFEEDPESYERPELEEMIRALKAKVSRRDAVVRVGQRLEAILVQLQATPAAHGKAAGAPVVPLSGPLALLRGGAG